MTSVTDRTVCLKRFGGRVDDLLVTPVNSSLVPQAGPAGVTLGPVEPPLCGPGERVPVRRSPYGANPTLGRHGTRARRELLDAARLMFAERGYHGAVVEAIGEAAGRSGSSVYQYFEGKGEIFQVLVEELRTDVLAAARQLGALERVCRGPGALEEVEARVAVLADVFGRHCTTFAVWPVAEQSEPALAGSYLTFVDDFAAAVRPVVEGAGVAERLGRSLAIGVAAMVQRAHFARFYRGAEVDAEELNRLLARVIAVALLGVADAPPADRRLVPALPARPVGAVCAARVGAIPGVRRTVTARSRATLDRIAAAARAVFRCRGFHGTSMNDVAVSAGVSHGSVYTYWPDRSALFTTLAHTAMVELVDHVEAAPLRFGSAADGRVWLEQWLELMATHGAVLRIWAHEVTDDERLTVLGEEMATYVDSFFRRLLAAAPAAGAVNEPAAHLVLWALLADIPYAGLMEVGVLSAQEVLDVQTALVLRGLFGYS